MPNIVVLTGNLGDDPEMFYTNAGEPIGKFDLAFRQGKQKTGWIKVVCFKQLAETAEKYLHKGARIVVIGSLDKESWETDQGDKRTTFQVIANNLEFLKTDGRGFENGQTTHEHESGN